MRIVPGKVEVGESSGLVEADSECVLVVHREDNKWEAVTLVRGRGDEVVEDLGSVEVFSGDAARAARLRCVTWLSGGSGGNSELQEENEQLRQQVAELKQKAEVQDAYTRDLRELQFSRCCRQEMAW